MLTPNLSFTANQLALNVNLILTSIAGSGGVLDISTTLTMSSNSTINAGDVLPTANNTYSLGDNAYQWLNANIGNVYVATQLVLPGTGTIQYLSVYELQNYSPYSQILISTSLVPTIDNTFYLGSQFFAYNTIYVNNIHSQGTIAINNTLNITGNLNPNTGSMYNMGGNGYSWNNIWGDAFIGGSYKLGGVTPGSLCYITSATSELDSASVAAPLVFSGSTLSLSTTGGFGNIIPAADLTYTIGSSTARWLSVAAYEFNAYVTGGGLSFYDSGIFQNSITWNSGGGLRAGILTQNVVIDDGNGNMAPLANRTSMFGNIAAIWTSIWATAMNMVDASNSVLTMQTATSISASYSIVWPAEPTGPSYALFTPAATVATVSWQVPLTIPVPNVQQGTSATSATATSGTFATLITVSFTPSSSTSTVRISATTAGLVSAAGAGSATVFRGATNCATALNAGSTSFQYFNLPTYYSPVAFTFVDAPATTSAISYTLQVYDSGAGGTSASIGLIGVCSVLLCEEIFS